MAEKFEPITTQEQFNAILAERLERAKNQGRAEVRAEYEDYEALKTANATMTAELETLKTGKSDLESQITKLTAEKSGLEMENLKTKIGIEAGIPIDMISRIAGNNEEELRADAAKFAKFVSISNPAPLKSNEPSGNSESAAYKELRNGLIQK